MTLPHDPTQARTRSGDCSEHAVLLTALLRARGIPARVSHGLVYLEQRARATAASTSGGQVRP